MKEAFLDFLTDVLIRLRLIVKLIFMIPIAIIAILALCALFVLEAVFEG